MCKWEIWFSIQFENKNAERNLAKNFPNNKNNFGTLFYWFLPPWGKERQFLLKFMLYWKIKNIKFEIDLLHGYLNSKNKKILRILARC